MGPFKTTKINQNNIDLFVFTSTAKFIYENFDVSRRIENKEEGYQRSFSKRRINDLAKYIKTKNGIIPNSVLVNIDMGKWKFDSDKNELELVGEPPYGLIIDGQHRIYGTHKASPDFQLPIVATAGLDVKDQAKLFVTINKTQKGVPTSLYLDLLNLTEGEIEDFDDANVPAERRGIEIAKRLNEEEDSPLYDLIRMTGESGQGIALNEFVTRSKYLIDPQAGKLLDFGFENQYTVFKVYFKAWKAVFIEQWEIKDSVMLQQTAFSGLILALYDVFQITIQYYRTFSTENLISLLNHIKSFKFDATNVVAGGVKAQEGVANKIIQSLKNNIKESQMGANLISE